MSSERTTRPQIEPARMRQLAQPTLWRTAAAIMADYLVIAGAIVCALHYRGLIAYLTVVLTIGGRQHSLLILMHEAAHGNLSRNRRLKSVIGQGVGRIVT